MASINPSGYLELLQNFQELAERNPYMLGLPHSNLPNIWVFESPSLNRLPRVSISFEIDEQRGNVMLWNCHLL